MNKAVSSMKLKEALISRQSDRRHKTPIGFVKYMNNWKVHSKDSRSSGHNYTNLEALPAKCSFVYSKTTSYSPL